MKLVTQNTFIDYLTSDQIIDYKNINVYNMAKLLAQNTNNKVEIAKNCFEFVRDKIKHSVDYQKNGISCSASQVLKNGHGFCYAKSHLLTALLRANSIPAGLCYQRLQMDDNRFALHGLVAVYLSDNNTRFVANNCHWYRLDPRGNQLRLTTQFSLSEENLAYHVQYKGEIDFTEILAQPLPCVVNVLNRYTDYQDIMLNLPDTEKIKSVPRGTY